MYKLQANPKEMLDFNHHPVQFYVPPGELFQQCIDLTCLPEMGYIMWQCRDEQRIGGMPIFVENLLLGTLALFTKITGRAKSIAPKAN